MPIARSALAYKRCIVNNSLRLYLSFDVKYEIVLAGINGGGHLLNSNNRSNGPEVYCQPHRK